MMAAPPSSAPCSKTMARAPASRASMPAAMPAPPAPTIAMSVSYCLPPAIGEVSPFAEVRLPLKWSRLLETDFPASKKVQPLPWSGGQAERNE